MSMSQWGLLLDIVAVLTLGLEAWVKTRGIQADSFTVGYGEVGGFWRCMSILTFEISSEVYGTVLCKP